MNFYTWLILFYVIIFGALGYDEKLKIDEKIACYKAAEINPKITCESK